MTKTSEKILKLFQDLGHNPPSGSIVRRTRAGHHQRSAGAWSWFLWNPDNSRAMKYGSQYPAHELIRLGAYLTEAKENLVGDIVVYPKYAYLALPKHDC